MSNNVRTKMVYDNNELIYKDMTMLIDTDYEESEDDDKVTVTIVQPSDINYSIEVYLISYTNSSDEEDCYEAETSEAYTTTFKADKNSTYFIILIDNTTNSLSTDYHLLNVASRGKLTRDITIKFTND